ncbi:prolyl oligopeptidase family serine peptidase [Luteimonas abyssi]|uniref:S9 family peptidase n=1 Tax=Luteimonas abyssi TaxID=1247514 RepID=UPI000B0075CC
MIASRYRRIGMVLTSMAAFAATGSAIAAPPRSSPNADDYARAERVLDTRLRGSVRNATVTPHWLPDGRFWYRRHRGNAQEGIEFVLVDPTTSARQPLFDPEALRSALITAGVGTPDDVASRVEAVEPDADRLWVSLRATPTQVAKCEIPTYHCHMATREIMPPQALAAPDNQRWLMVRDHNLWLHGREMTAQPLTVDGEDGFGYGVLPDFSLRAIPRRAGRVQAPPFAVWWSPEGERVFGVRYDERRLTSYPYLDSSPGDGARPVVHTVRLGLLGDTQQVRSSWFALDVADGGNRVIPVPEGWQALTEAGALGWAEDGRKVYTAIARYDRPARLRLVEIDLVNGSVRTLHEERSETRVQLNALSYQRPAVVVLPAQDRIVWFSQRDGWGHLYLLDRRSGRVERQLTHGNWLVRDIVGVDADAGQLYVTGSGREPGDPYLRRLYRVPLDGGDPHLLGTTDADHAVDAGAGTVVGDRAPNALSPLGNAIVDTYSTLSQPPRSVLRAVDDGRVLLTLEDADASTVIAAGWRPPRREQLFASDGHTPIYATIYLPPNYREDGNHPLIDAMYGGVFLHNAPVSYVEAVSAHNPVSRASLAKLGFVVVTIDGRGTAGRDKAFHDASFVHAADVQLDDHVAAIAQLAERYPGIDATRIGIYGHSFGGYSAARALLRYPDVYSVGVASAGSHNFQGIYGGAIHGMDRLFVGQPESDPGADGHHGRGVPAAFAALDNATLADRLRGNLLLVYGELDEHAMPALTLQLAAALNRADRDYDLLYLAGQDHELFRNDRVFTRRLWDYFVRHLHGAEPPEYSLAPLPR